MPFHIIRPIELRSHRLLSMTALLAAFAMIACGGKGSKGEKKTEQRVADSGAHSTQASSTGAPQALAWYDLKEKEPESFELPKKLREISGIALAADGRLFAHGDERAAIFQLDTASGEIVKEFYLGREGGMSGDFELAIAEGATLVRIGSGAFGARPRP